MKIIKIAKISSSIQNALTQWQNSHNDLKFIETIMLASTANLSGIAKNTTSQNNILRLIHSYISQKNTVTQKGLLSQNPNKKEYLQFCHNIAQNLAVELINASKTYEKPQ